MDIEDKKSVVISAYDEDDAYDESAPEKGLLMAILLSAINDLKRQGRIGRQAQEFFLNQSDEYIFSFKSICDYLSVDPQKILIVTGLEGNDKKQVKSLSLRTHG